MPQALTYPGVYVEEVPSGVRTIAGVATSIGLFIGWATRGPVNEGKRIFSFPEFEREYGGLDHRSYLGHAVRNFFDNGGSDAYIIRIASEPDPDDSGSTPATAATTKLDGMDIKASSPGEWAHAYSLRLLKRATPDEKRFKIDVMLGEVADNVVVETFENLSKDVADSRFVEAIINARSSIIRVVVPATPADPADDEATLGDSSGTPGDDGDVLDPNEAPATTIVPALFDTGGGADKIDIFNLVCVPGLTDGETIKKLETGCKKKRAFLIVDCPEDSTIDSADEDVVKCIGADPSYAAFYFPWVRAADPLQEGGIRNFPPCGYVAGVMARTDGARGVWKAPAGIDTVLNGALEFKVPMSDAQNGALNPKAVNCLRTLPVYGNVVWGSRTLDGDNDRGSEWKYVPVRRMALFLEESLFRGTQWVVFEPNDEPLWAQIRLNIGAFMQQLFRQGAFQGATPREAYFVKCDRTTTTQADINLGVVNILVGFAPLKPAEFVVIRIQQIAGEITT
jgi:Bacteriophage tail sheath protein